MSLGAGIHDFLSAGLSVGQRVYPLALPQRAELPALAYRVVSAVPVTTHSDAQGHPTHTGSRYVVSRVQFDCYGATYDTAEALCDELLGLVVGYRGAWGEVEVDSVIADIRLDDWEGEPSLYRVVQDVQVGHRITATST